MSRPRNNSLPPGPALRLNEVPRPRVRWTTTRHVVQAVPGGAANKQANIQAWPTGVAGCVDAVAPAVATLTGLRLYCSGCVVVVLSRNDWGGVG